MKRSISFVCVLVFVLFLSVSNCLANEVRSELNNNLSNYPNVNNTRKNNNDEKNNVPNASNEDIFGDEQAFPFIAGLGKNAAH